MITQENMMTPTQEYSATSIQENMTTQENIIDTILNGGVIDDTAFFNTLIDYFHDLPLGDTIDFGYPDTFSPVDDSLHNTPSANSQLP